MSYTELYRIDADGAWDRAKPERFKNSHGWTTFVWTALVRKYALEELRTRPRSAYGALRIFAQDWKPPHETHPVFQNYHFLWDIVEAFDKSRPSLSDEGAPLLELRCWEENVLRATYDHHMVRFDDLPMFADSLELFAEAHETGRTVNHLAGMAHVVRGFLDSGSAFTGVCWYPTSLSQHPWVDCEDGEEVPYNFVTSECRHEAAPIHFTRRLG